MLYKRGTTWWVQFDTPTGRVRKSARTEIRKEAQEYHDTLRAEIWRQGTLKERPLYRWDEAVLRWLDEKAHKASIDDDRNHLGWLTRYLKGRKLVEIDRATVDGLTKKRKEGGASNATVNRTLAALRSLLRAAMGWDWLDKAPVIKLLPEQKRRIRWLTQDEAARLLRELPKHQADIARFALLTGLRQRNILDLAWSQIDMPRGVAWIHPDQAKARKPIGVPLSPEAREILREQLGRHPEFVFTYEGAPIGQVNTGAWKKALRRAGISDFRWHDLRHTWASWHVQAGTPLDKLQEMGGWESFEMVRKYAHLAPEHLTPFASNVGIKDTKKAQGPAMALVP